MGKQTQDEMLLCSNELFVVGHSPYSNLANILLASSCDKRRTNISLGSLLVLAAFRLACARLNTDG
jgi:hypothetical protein